MHMDRPVTLSSTFILRLPVHTQSNAVKTVDYHLSTLLLDLLSLTADPDAHSRDSLINGTPVQTITLLKETDQSMKDLLQYLLFPYHFPINQSNYSNLLRLATKYQIVTLVEELIVFMNASNDHGRIFLEACQYHLEPVRETKEDLIILDFPNFIMSHTSEELAVVNSTMMKSLLDRFMELRQMDGNETYRLSNVEHLQAFRLLYSYALQGILYADLSPVSALIKFRYGD